MQKIYDTIIIGGGPAGLIAGYECIRLNKDFLILEKNNKIGKKLAITGKGRCNITTNNNDLDNLISKYQKNGKFLYSSFSRFSVQDTLDFFVHDLGIDIKIERGNRIFPKSDNALEIIYKFEERLRENILSNTHVIDFKYSNNNITSVLANKGEYFAKKYILCTGGKSYPVTGSTGDGYTLSSKLGHTISEPKPALVPVICKEKWIKDLAGLSLKHVNISAIQNSKVKDRRFGEALFTHKGLSGPIIIDMSRNIGDLLEKDKVYLNIDLKPALDEKELNRRILNDFSKYSKKQFKNSLDDLLPKSLIPVIIELSKINPSKNVSDISKEERYTLVKLLKGLNIEVISLEDWDNAIVTSGGINIKEIDPQTMKSKIIDNLYFAGEIIDVYGPTGGYNLQICWSTGIIATRN